MKRLKSDSGITLTLLLTTVVIMLILAGVGVTTATNYFENIKLKKFNAELDIINKRVNVISKKIESGNDNYLKLGKVLNTNEKEFLKKLNFNENTIEGFKLFDKSDLELIDLIGIEQSVYINFNTRQVVSKNGINVNGKNYYMINE